MKAHLYKYTTKTISNGKEFNIRYIGYFKNLKTFNDYINYQNALSYKYIFYISKTDNKFNKTSDSRTVPPNNPVRVNKHSSILT